MWYLPFPYPYPYPYGQYAMRWDGDSMGRNCVFKLKVVINNRYPFINPHPTPTPTSTDNDNNNIYLYISNPTIP
jgi:hypothetical protein